MLRSLLCRAWMLQGLRCVRCGCEFYAESVETCGLVILSDLSAYTTSPKSLPPARPSRAKMVDIVLSFVVLCRSRKDRHPSLEHLCVRLLTRLSACLLNFPVQLSSRLTPSRQPTEKVRAAEYAHASAMSMIAASSPARGESQDNNLQQRAADGFRRRCYLALGFLCLYCVHAPSLL